jgi:hypothetical protein
MMSANRKHLLVVLSRQHSPNDALRDHDVGQSEHVVCVKDETSPHSLDADSSILYITEGLKSNSGAIGTVSGLDCQS